MKTVSIKGREYPVFEKKADAQAVADKSNDNLYECCYYLSHGEFSRPEYRPVRYKEGWGIKILFFYYAGTFNAPKDHRASVSEI